MTRLSGHAWSVAMAAVALGLALSPLGAGAVAAATAIVAIPLLGAAAVRRHAGPAAAVAEHAGLPEGARLQAQRPASLAAIAGGAALLIVAGGLAGTARLRAIDAPAAAVTDGDAFAGEVVTLGRPRASAFGASVEAGVRSGSLRGARVLVRVPRWRRWPAAGAGELVALRGTLRRLRLGSRGSAAMFAAHLRRRGIAGELMLESARRTGLRRGGWRGVVDGMRARSERAMNASLPPPQAELLRGMVLGQDEDIAAPVRDDFRASGLAHLLAVSGQNVMLLAALALPLLAVAGLRVGARCGVLLGLIAVYVPLAGAGPSLQRAAVMGAAGIVAMAGSRPASRVYALLLAASVTLALNPRSAGDPGWQLSFAAVAAIVWLVPPLQARLRSVLRRDGPGGEGPRGRLLEGLADGVALTLVATLATAPLLAFHFGSAPLAGLPANLLALPAVAPAMWLGMLEVAMAQLGEVARPAGALLGALARPPVAYIGWLAERFAGMPGGQLAVPLRTPATVALAYALLGAAVVAAGRAGHGLGARLEEAAGRLRRLPRATRLGAGALAIATVALAGAGGLASPRPPGALTVRFLDVGQGDATLIQHPDGTAVLFDAGPPEAGVARQLRRAGVRRLAVLVATHASRDHHGGIEEVLRRIPVGVMLDGGDGTRDRGMTNALATARERGARLVRAVAPLTLHAGGLEITVLSPPPRPPGPPPEDPNPRAVVALVGSGGFQLLLSADAESEALLPLSLPDVDAMKVPHHGSADPGLPEALDRLRPEVAAIEVGARNGYGHPAPSTLRALGAAGARIFRTDRDGTVTLTAGADRLSVETER